MPDSDSNAQESNQDQLQEEFLKSLSHAKVGELIKGTVIHIDNEFVYLDVGLKSDGRIPIDEFVDLPANGDSVQVILLERETSSGGIVISKKKAEMRVFWKDLKTAFENQMPVNGKVLRSVKGGYEISLGCDMKAFCPISKMDIQRIGTPEDYIGLESPFIIDRLFSENKVNIVLTRRLWLERETEKNLEAFFEQVNVGDEVEGVIKSFTSFGAFIDLGGFDGLLHMNDMNWGHVNRPRDYVKKGEKIKLKVIRLDHENKKINLSLKHFQPDPWSTFEEKYHLNQIVKGRVTKMTNFGAFIEFEEGIEGLAHISEFSWIKRVKHPNEIFSIGDECEAMILGYDVPNGRISLGIKQVLPNPWDEIDKKYPVGTKGKWLVKKITNAGAFVQLEDGIEAFLHSDDLSWTRKIRNVGSMLTENEEIEAVVISVSPQDRRIRLGIKQLNDDPWIGFQKKYPMGTIIKGEIISKTEFGAFVKTDEDIEGLLHKNNLPTSSESNSDEELAALRIGDVVEVAIIEINPARQKLSLSMKEAQLKQEQAEISKYMDSDDDSKDSYTLADMLEDKSE